MKEIKIAYIGGGSTAWARNLMNDLALEGSFKAEVFLYDINYDSALDNEKIANELFSREEAVGKHHFIAVKTIEEALKGSDFVVISILPATLKEMQSDVHTPEKYGIYQSVGDTVGPGGILRALRTVPIYKEFALKIKEFCPNAWVINYTNPMSMCVKALYEAFPQIKAFGCCHEVFGTQSLIASAFRKYEGVAISRNEVKINVAGINHFTWITEAKYKDYNLLDSYKKLADEYYETGFQSDDNYHWKTNPMVFFHRVKFDLFKRYGVVAAAGDRHLAEFCPKDWYLKNPDQVHEWAFNLTPVSYRENDYKERAERTRKYLSGEEKLKLQASGEEGVKLIKALCGLGDCVSNCNLPNVGQMQGIDEGVIVETNAVFSADSVKPVCAGRLKEEVLNLVRKVASEQTTVVKAILNEDYERVFQCFANDNLVDLPVRDAKKLFIEMLTNTKDYIPNVEKYLEYNK